MDREKLTEYLLKAYRAKTDFPWKTAPSYQVFRHEDGKWFAVIMEIKKNRVGLNDEGVFQVVNLKNSPLSIGVLTKKRGIFPAYHMNKEHWITVALDGTIEEQELKLLVEISYQATKR